MSWLLVRMVFSPHQLCLVLSERLRLEVCTVYSNIGLKRKNCTACLHKWLWEWRVKCYGVYGHSIFNVMCYKAWNFNFNCYNYVPSTHFLVIFISSVNCVIIHVHCIRVLIYIYIFIIQHIDTLPKYGQKTLDVHTVGPRDIYPTIDVHM